MVQSYNIPNIFVVYKARYPCSKILCDKSNFQLSLGLIKESDLQNEYHLYQWTGLINRYLVINNISMVPL